jgi:V8-like Glu-specific endopeptidase
MGQPQALLSFTKNDDDYEKGKLTHLRDKLSAAVRFQSGEEFLIFQPHQDMQWGQRRQERIREALAQVFLFIPVVTPSYLNDAHCREELTLFLERERSLGRDDLVLPIRYLPTSKLDTPGSDDLAQALATRESVDWTSLRRAALDSPEVTETIEQMATHVVAALGRAMAVPAEASSPEPAPSSSSPPATPPTPPSTAPPPTDEQRHQTDLLRRNLQHLMAVEKQLVQHSGDVSLQISRDDTITAINQSAAALGLGTYPQAVGALVQAAGLHTEYTAFLEHQRQALVEYQRRLKRQEIGASPLQRVNIQMQLDDVASRRAAIEAQQTALIAYVPATPAPTATTHTEAESGRLYAPMLPLVDAQRLLDCADSVAQVKVGQFVRGKLEGGRVTGTAWLIAPDLALTCWHVLHARHPDDEAARAADVAIQAENCLLTFNFTEIGAGIDYAVERLECADRNSYGLDYALLRLRNRDDRPLQARTPLTFDTDTPLRQISELYIIQHPRGMQQYGADGHFVAYTNQNHRMHYTNNTAEGTSGSPVLLRPYWRVVALHHGATRDRLHGEGIALRPILDDIKRQQPNIYAEIMNAQSTHSS